MLKAFFFEYFNFISVFVIGTSASEFGRLLRNKGGNIKYRYIRLAGLSILTIPFMIPTAINTIGETTGIKIDFHLYKIFGLSSEVASGPEAQSTKIAKSSNSEICKLALTPNLASWSAEASDQPYVAEAKRRVEVVNSCRIILGLQTLEEEASKNETKTLAMLTNKQVCIEAFDERSATFRMSADKKPSVHEAVKRGLSPSSCSSLLGVVPNGTTQDMIASQPTAAEPVAASMQRSSAAYAPQPQSPQQLQSSTLPSGAMRNPNAIGYTNLRRQPDKNSETIAKLPNGLEVVILGLYASPSGKMWCKVGLNNGTTGFVFADFVAGNCSLTDQQQNLALQLEQQRNEQSAQAVGSLLGAFIQAIPKH